MIHRFFARKILRLDKILLKSLVYLTVMTSNDDKKEDVKE